LKHLPRPAWAAVDPSLGTVWAPKIVALATGTPFIMVLLDL